eukprot:8431494-Pyramimonas_sp.AAC.1
MAVAEGWSKASVAGSSRISRSARAPLSSTAETEVSPSCMRGACGSMSECVLVPRTSRTAAVTCSTRAVSSRAHWPCAHDTGLGLTSGTRGVHLAVRG